MPNSGHENALALSEGCAHCREAEPALCEGYCLYCGREVLTGTTKLVGRATGMDTPGGTQTARPLLVSQSQHGGNNTGIDRELTYGERLSVAWLLIWRGSIVAAAISFVTGLPVWISAATDRATTEGLSTILSFLATLLVVAVVVIPWLVQVAVKKRFRGFSFVVVRVSGLRKSAVEQRANITYNMYSEE